MGIVNPKSNAMTATNINIEDFVNILTQIYNSGIKLVNLDMLPDESHPSMNKLVIHPVKASYDASSDYLSQQQERTTNIIAKNPSVRTDNDDIFNLFNEIL